MAIFSNEIRVGWKALIWWTVGLIAACLVYLPFYESIGASPEMESVLDSMPRGLIVGMGFDLMFSGAGYVHSSILELTAAVLVIIAVVGWGAWAIAGDEEEGTLELTLAHGVSRRRVYAERALALAMKTAILGIALWVILAVSSVPFALDLRIAFVTAGVASFTLLAMTIGFVTLAVGAASGHKNVAVSVGAGIAVAAYVMNVVGRQSESAEWIAKISPFGWAFGDIPIMNGWDWPGLALLAGLGIVAFISGFIAVDRRDIQS